MSHLLLPKTTTTTMTTTTTTASTTTTKEQLLVYVVTQFRGRKKNNINAIGVLTMIHANCHAHQKSELFTSQLPFFLIPWVHSSAFEVKIIERVLTKA